MAEAPPKKLITVFTPVYNEQETVETCCAEVRKVMQSLAERYDYEHIFGDNRSRDRTLAVLEKLATEDPHVKVVAYSRNFGFERSSATLLRHASGDAVVGITADLQEPPSLIPEMVRLWEQGNEVVYGVYRNPNERVVMRLVRRLYYWLIDKLSPERLPHGFTGFSLLDRRVLDEVNAVDDQAPFLRGIIATVGFRQVAVPFERAQRRAGRSKNGLGVLFDFGINGIISYSIVPIPVTYHARWRTAQARHDTKKSMQEPLASCLVLYAIRQVGC